MSAAPRRAGPGGRWHPRRCATARHHSLRDQRWAEHRLPGGRRRPGRPGVGPRVRVPRRAQLGVHLHQRVPRTAPPVLPPGHPGQAGLRPVRPQPRGGHPRRAHGRHPGRHGRRGPRTGRTARRVERRADRVDVRGDVPRAGLVAGAVHRRLPWGPAPAPGLRGRPWPRPGVLDDRPGAEQHRPPRPRSVRGDPAPGPVRALLLHRRRRGGDPSPRAASPTCDRSSPWSRRPRS